LHDNGSINEALPKFTYVLKRNAEALANMFDWERKIDLSLDDRSASEVPKDPK
jgi:hypothetical protein